MTTHDNLAGAVWRKASYSNGNGGDCVEVAHLDGGHRAVRDSKNPTGAVLIVGSAEWSELITAVRTGQFD